MIVRIEPASDGRIARAPITFEGVCSVQRADNYLYIRKHDESWTYPWSTIRSVHVEGCSEA